jgi:hypothetical protein
MKLLHLLTLESDERLHGSQVINTDSHEAPAKVGFIPARKKGPR